MANRIPLHCQSHCAARECLQHPSEMALESLMKSKEQKHLIPQGQGETLWQSSSVQYFILHVMSLFVLIIYS